MRRAGITLRLGEKVSRIERPKSAAGGGGNGDESLVHAVLESGKVIRAETLLYAIGRQGTTGALN
jgi:pyruvate/2-oxoglutarate dehydrogenase complex dihydrolipoamide dehydrogenase (E3) component